MSERELATIQKITSIEKHPNADTLDIATIKGWNVIVKQGIHKVNDLVAYFEIDSFLPVKEQYEFLRKGNFKSTQNLGDGFRLRTMKLRGVVSQGLILPLSAILNDLEDQNYFGDEGEDLTEILGIQKYEKPIPSNLQGKVRGNFPSFIPKTDQERVQNLTKRDYDAHGLETFEVTTKLDGSSMTVYHNEGQIGVCSRNFDLDETEDNLFWQVYHKCGMDKIFNNDFNDDKPRHTNFALQGELVGPGVNNNHSKLTQHDFYLFDVYLIDQKRYLNPSERQEYFNELKNVGINIKHVPILDTWDEMPDKDTALSMAEHEFNGHQAEGIVFKSMTSQFSYKAISDKYLLKHNE
jgi:RNA ligase (TIGR02306 family)